MPAYDAIVIGVGGMGSAALYHLARRGVKVLGLEQFDIAHDRGSSHGESRLIRKAYFEHPDYVPLVRRSYELWAELEAAAGRKLFHRSGLLLAGPRDGAVVSGVRRAAAAHALDIQAIAPKDWRTRFPEFVVSEGMDVLFEPDAGFLEVESCVRTYVQQAVEYGATVVTGRSVQGWSADGGGVAVRTPDEVYHADRLVICGGSWSSRLLASLRLPLEVRRKVVFWFESVGGAYSFRCGCPVFGFDVEGGLLYGFPSIDERSVKIADHAGGQAAEDADRLDRRLHPEDEPRVHAFVKAYLPRLTTKMIRHSVCMYTMTPDEHFIIDRHPEYPHVAYAAGFSGHGFKFAPIVGSVLADFTVQDRTDEPVGFLRAARPMFPD